MEAPPLTTLNIPFITGGGPADPEKAASFMGRKSWWDAKLDTPDAMIQLQSHKTARKLAPLIGIIVGVPDPLAEMRRRRTVQGDQNVCAHRVVLKQAPYWCIASSDDSDLIVRIVIHGKVMNSNIFPCSFHPSTRSFLSSNSLSPRLEIMLTKFFAR